MKTVQKSVWIPVSLLILASCSSPKKDLDNLCKQLGENKIGSVTDPPTRSKLIAQVAQGNVKSSEMKELLRTIAQMDSEGRSEIFWSAAAKYQSPEWRCPAIEAVFPHP